MENQTNSTITILQNKVDALVAEREILLSKLQGLNADNLITKEDIMKVPNRRTRQELIKEHSHLF